MKPMRFCNVLGVFLLCCFGAAHMPSRVNAQASVPLVATEAPAGFDRRTNGHTTQAEFVEVEEIFARKAAIARRRRTRLQRRLVCGAATRTP